jgi:DNA-binding MarR family transcriptional regulator
MNHIPKEVASTILLTIYRGGKLTMSEIYEKTKFSTITIQNHVNALMKAGFLEEERETSFPRRRMVKLSKEGGRVAMTLNLADNSEFGPSDLIDLGAKAGRIAAYHESILTLRSPAASREYTSSELLLKGVGTLSSGLLIVAKGLPEEMADKSEALKRWAGKLEGYYIEGQKRLVAKDVNGCVGAASKALAEFNGASELMADVKKWFKEQKFDELANYIEFLSPKTTQKG